MTEEEFLEGEKEGGFFGSFLTYFLSVKNLQAGHESKAEMTHIQFVDHINP